MRLAFVGHREVALGEVFDQIVAFGHLDVHAHVRYPGFERRGLLHRLLHALWRRFHRVGHSVLSPRGARMRIVEMKNIVIGTAGHIDHGKTALVRALTGIDTDRLKEEKQRGISIDLGFAHLQLSENVRLGLVDVPGHERFIKNMLAGVSGIDLVLFVIASDESIKPQTREHFDICMLLGIRKGIVVLTKADLADGDLLELAELEADEFVRGSFLEDSPVVAVSAATGAGLDELRSELARLAATVPEKDASRVFPSAHRSRLRHARIWRRGNRHAGFGHRPRGSGNRAASSAQARACARHSGAWRRLSKRLPPGNEPR